MNTESQQQKEDRAALYRIISTATSQLPDYGISIADGNAQLHQAEVQEIRNSSESCRALATRFEIGKSQVANIKKGLQWKNL